MYILCPRAILAKCLLLVVLKVVRPAFPPASLPVLTVELLLAELFVDGVVRVTQPQTELVAAVDVGLVLLHVVLEVLGAGLAGEQVRDASKKVTHVLFVVVRGGEREVSASRMQKRPCSVS